jgi:hypothetical protein
MKSKTIKHLLIIGLFPILCFSQENSFKIHSISAGFGYIGFSSNDIDNGDGLNFVADFTTSYNKNLFSVYFNIGGDADILKQEDGETSEISITYGREWDLTDRLKFEAHAGLGYFNWGYSNSSTFFLLEKETTIGFPVRAKLIYYFTNNFGVGINPNANFNSLATTYSVDLIIQYKF